MSISINRIARVRGAGRFVSRGLASRGSLVLAALLSLGAGRAPALARPVGAASSASHTATERANRETVRRAYAAWARGGTKFFDILAPNATWTIKGSGKSAATYRSKAAFLKEAVAPFGARLSSPIVPTVRQIFVDGDQVIILWDGRATTKDGQPYRNSYAWFFKMKGGKAVEVKAFLDLPAYDDVLRRVKPHAAKR